MDITDGMRIVTFKTPNSEKRGFQELMLIGKSVRVGKDGKYMISARECSHLKDKGIAYHIVKKL